MKNSAHIGGCYPPRLNTLLDLQNYSYPTQLHSIIIANYCDHIVVLHTCNHCYQLLAYCNSKDTIL